LDPSYKSAKDIQQLLHLSMSLGNSEILEDPNFKESNYDFNWEVISYKAEERAVEIQIDFKDARYISNGGS
jgi:hypothetical protein